MSFRLRLGVVLGAVAMSVVTAALGRSGLAIVVLVLSGLLADVLLSRWGESRGDRRS